MTSRRLVVSLVLAGVAVSSCSSGSVAPSDLATTTTPTASPTPVPTHETFVDLYKKLPHFSLASGKGPTSLVAQRFGSIARYDSRPEAFSGYLTPKRSTKGGTYWDPVISGSKAWFVHDLPRHTTKSTSCGDPKSRIESVPLDGGSPTVVVPRYPNKTYGEAVAVTDDGNTVAYATEPCSNHPPHAEVIVRQTGQPTKRIVAKSVNNTIYSVTVGHGRLAFLLEGKRRSQGRSFNHDDLGDAQIYSVRLRDLKPGRNPLRVATKAHYPEAACGWRTVKITDLGILANRFCALSKREMRTTPTLFRLNPRNLKPIAQGPKIGQDYFTSDEAGHILIDDFTMVSWTKSGRHKIGPGRCTTPDTLYTHCANDASW